ncbi:MAG: hypothetical protein FWH55_12930, partial [Oscillospiraceae bacterium]|nr:hypothetical protein [Oscillospiraceae bacterium]
PDLYVDFSGVTSAIAAVVPGLNITGQATVNGYADSINAAVAALVYKGADYSSVEAAIAAAEALNPDLYVDFSGVTSAIAAVVPGLNITGQATVNGYADAINAAVAALVYKGADYTAVDAAIAAAEALNPDLYVDFSGVTSAIAAVVPGLNITEQSTVNGYADAINAAVAALVYRGADYSSVEAAIAAAEALNPDLYVDFSGVTSAIAAVVPGLNITEQAAVNGYADVINAAVAALEYRLMSLSATTSSANLQNSTTVTITVMGHYGDGTVKVMSSASVKLKQSGAQTVKVGEYDVTVVVNSNNKITGINVVNPITATNGDTIVYDQNSESQEEGTVYTVTSSSMNLQNSTTVTLTVKDTSGKTVASASVKLKQSGTQIVKVGEYDVTVVVNSNNKITDIYIV